MLPVRFISDDRPRYKAGQCVELHEFDAAIYMARGMCEGVTPADVREYEATQELIAMKVDRAVDNHFNATRRHPTISEADRRCIVEDVIAKNKYAFDPKKWDRMLGGRSAYSYLFGTR